MSQRLDPAAASSSTAVATAATAREQLVRLGGLARRALRFWRPALGVLCVGLAATAAVDRWRPRTWRSEALIVQHEGIRWSALVGESGDTVRRLGQPLRQTTLARTPLQRLVEEHGLYAGELDPVEELRRRIALRSSGDSLVVSYDGPSPAIAHAVVARIANSIVDESARSQREQAQRTRDFLDAEDARSEKELQQIEVALARFLAEHPELARRSQAPGEVGAMLRAADEKGGRRDLEPALLTLELQLEAVRASRRVRAQQAERSAAVPPALAADGSPAARQQAEAEVLAARRELANKLEQYTDRHPDVVSARRRLEAAEARLARAGGAPAAHSPAAQATRPGGRPAPAPYSDAGDDEIAKLTAQIAALESIRRRDRDRDARSASSDVASVVALETEWARLSRDLAQAQERHHQIESRLFRAAMLVSAAGPQMVIVDPPYVPTRPRPPGRRQVMAVGGAASLALALLLGVLLALVDDRVRERADIARLGVPVLAVVPRLRRRGRRRAPREPALAPPRPPSPLVFHAAPDSPQAAAYRVLRYRLSRAGDPRLIAVAGATPADGAATCAANLALALAERDRRRVLLVDADLRAPRMAALFGVTPAAAGSTVAGPDGAPLRLLAAPAPAAQESLRLAVLDLQGREDALDVDVDGAAFAGATRALVGEHFDYVVIVAPPVLGSADANLVAALADALLLTASAGRSSSRALAAALEQLASERVAGAALLDA